MERSTCWSLQCLYRIDVGMLLDKNDNEHFLWALRQISRRYARARRIDLNMDNGPSHIDQHTRSYLSGHGRFRPL